MTKILVIEDETILRDNIVTWLTYEGYEAIGAVDGVDGVNLAFLHQPDLIICDINMPRLDGYEVLLEVQSNSTTRLTPFIFLTAKAGSDDLRVGMALGADDYVTKPFDQLDLLHAIQTRLDRKAAQNAEHEQQISLFKEALAHERRQHLLQAPLAVMFSHDVRALLTDILASNSLLRDFIDKMSTSQRLAHNDRINASARQLVQMVDDMLLVAQMETGSFHFQPEPVNPGSFFQGILADFQAIDGQAHPIQFESRLPETIMADPRLLRQIFVHVMSNAVQYSPPNSPVRVLLEKDEGQCLLTVEDQGAGIPEADLPHLSDDLQRATSTGEVSGARLGLAIVKRAVEEHGGTIGVASEAGVGTRVTVRLPL